MASWSDVRALLESWADCDVEKTTGDIRVLVGLWQRHGRVMNLTSDLAESALVAQVCEGLVATAVVKQLGLSGSCWVDVGAGGGFPGLLMALGLAGHGLLVEPRRKRADFLDMALARLGLRHVRVCCARMGQAATDGVRWPVLSARAVFDPIEWLKFSSDFAARGKNAVLVHQRESDPTVVELAVACGHNVNVLRSCVGVGWRVTAVRVPA